MRKVYMVRVTLPPAVESKGKVSTIPEAAVPFYRISGREIGWQRNPVGQNFHI